MAACPWCKVQAEVAFIGNNYYAYCMSPMNPDNKKKGDKTKTGVAYSRCAEGKEVSGLNYKKCPFFKKKTKR